MNRNDNKKAPRRMTVDARKSADRQDQDSKSTEPGRKQGKAMSPALQAHIGRQVRAMFDEVAEEPVPDHLLKLLQDLDRDGDN